MNERITRKGDERLYQPQLHSRRVKELHFLKEKTGEPMTIHLDRAVENYFKNQETGEFDVIEPETWEEHLEEIETLNQYDRERNTDIKL